MTSLLLFLALMVCEQSINARPISKEEREAIAHLKTNGYDYAQLSSYEKMLSTQPFDGTTSRSTADHLAGGSTFDEYLHEIKEFTRINREQTDLNDILGTGEQSSIASEESRKKMYFCGLIYKKIWPFLVKLDSIA